MKYQVVARYSVTHWCNCHHCSEHGEARTYTMNEEVECEPEDLEYELKKLDRNISVDAEDLGPNDRFQWLEKPHVFHEIGEDVLMRRLGAPELWPEITNANALAVA